MDHTIGYLLCCQSPALFLLTLVLLIAWLLRRKNHKFIAALDLICAFVSAALGVALYFIGMRFGHFTIDDFYRIRVVGWVGVGLVAVVSAVTALKAFMKMTDRRRTEKAAIRAENARLNQEKMAAQEAAKAAEQPAPQPPKAEEPAPAPAPAQPAAVAGPIPDPIYDEVGK